VIAGYRHLPLGHGLCATAIKVIARSLLVSCADPSRTSCPSIVAEVSNLLDPEDRSEYPI
jgi:hypothetical protein